MHMAGGKRASYKLATYRTSDGPRAGVIVGDDVFDAEKITGKAAYATVAGILADWKAAEGALKKAAAGAAKSMPDDFRVSITNAPGAGAYPICSFTWLLIPQTIKDGAKRDAIKTFLKWMLTDGQGYNEALSYAKLPKEVVDQELHAINKVQ